MKRIVLVLTQFFPPEPCAAAHRVAAMIEALLEVDFDVHVLTGVANFPTGVIKTSDRVTFVKTTTLKDLSISRVRTYASPVLSGRNRLLNWLSVAFGLALYIIASPRRYDAVIVTVPPITLALPALFALIRYRTKLIVDVRDVFPEVAVRMGYWSEKGVPARLVGWIARCLYRAAILVICVTESAFAEIVARGSDPNRTVLVPNGYDHSITAARSPYEREAGEFVAVFAGNMGLATGLDTLLDTAQDLKKDRSFRFVLAGDGADRARITARVEREQLSNVTLLGAIPRAAANALLADADVCIVPLHASLLDSLPTKLFDALALGCPVICCGRGEARNFVERSGGGIVVEPSDRVALGRALREFRDAPHLRGAFSDRGRAYVNANYDRKRIMRGLASRLAHIWFPD